MSQTGTIPQPNTILPNAFQPNAFVGAEADDGTLDRLIRDPSKKIFRRAFIKRRYRNTGLYETDWLEITEYVVKWGSLSSEIDSDRINRFVLSGVSLRVKSDFGEFNPETDPNSLFFRWLSRYRTLLKIEAGYVDEDGTEYPGDKTQGIFILTGEIELSAKSNEVNLDFQSLMNPFEETPANEINGLKGTLTASEMVELIRDATDGSGNNLFTEFITSTAWDIDTTTTNYEINTTTVLDGLSCWDLLTNLAESENHIVYIKRDGTFFFGSRDISNVSFDLIGRNYSRPNLIEISSYKEAIDKLYTSVRLKFEKEDTSTSYVNVGGAIKVDPATYEWIFRKRILEASNELIPTPAIAQSVANNIRAEFSFLKKEMAAHCLFLPTIELLDRTNVFYKQEVDSGEDKWDTKNWADSTTVASINPMYWAGNTLGAFNFYGKEFKVIGKKTDLDNMKTSLVLREP